MKEPNDAHRDGSEAPFADRMCEPAAKGDIDDFIFAGEYEYIKTVSER